MINLEDIKNKNNTPFDVPSGYFEGLETKILAKAKRQRTFKLGYTITSIAAVVAMAIIIPMQSFKKHSDFDYLLSQASNEEIISLMELIEIDPLEIEL